MKTGAVITAAGMSSRMGAFKPLLKIGSLSAAEHVILNFRFAGVRNIALVTGNNAAELENSLKRLDIVFLRNDMYRNNEMFDSVKIGLNYLKDKCDKIFISPIDIPLFAVDTVKALLRCRANVGIPVYNGKGGHPIILDNDAANRILQYTGDGGLRDAIIKLSLEIERLEVKDQGMLYDMNTQTDYTGIVQLSAGKGTRD